MSYEIVIGLEVHVQLNTATKAFCSDAVVFGDAPNTHVSPVSLGHPSTLPFLNEKVIESAVKLGLALGCRINTYSYFDRKHYFYPDLPKGYQITQDARPICVGGSVEFPTDNGTQHVRLHHIHIEEDAGKLLHDNASDTSLIDLNRAGTPLLEIVSEPDLRSSDAAYAYIAELRKIVRYLGISDGNMEEGSIRCDCNVSVRLKGAEKLGNRCEIKNVNSMRNAKRAIEFEANRQIKILEKGGIIEQQTRGFDPDNGTTFSLRSKENAPDYRYFPEPDLPPIRLSDAYLAAVTAALPALPNTLRQQFIEAFDLAPTDASILTEERPFAQFFLDLTQHTPHPKTAANWLIHTVRGYLNETQTDLSTFPLSPQQLADLVNLVENGTVNQLTAKQQLFPAFLEAPNETPQTLAQRLNLLQTNDSNLLSELLDQAIEQYPDKFEALQKGKQKFMGLFVGEVMRGAKGKANPQQINELILKRIKDD